MSHSDANAEAAAEAIFECTFDRVFCAFLRGDSALLERVAACAGDLDVTGNALTFTLPGLYDFACRCDDSPDADARPGRAGYLRFRQQIYAQPTNARLAEFGGRIEIERAGTRHDETRYRLVRTRPPGSAAAAIEGCP